MVANIIDAVSAYRKATEIPKEVASIGAVGAKSGNSFGDMLQQVIGDSVEQLKSAEQVSRLGALGKANPVEIATAISGAETTVQMMVTLRDRMISAYQEITRMNV
ncbi:MAG: flagellar hook-basal body complex protein FliE [Alphaproteobacteria bacterium]